MTVAVPTLAAGDALAECLRSLESQTVTDFEVVVIDNSGRSLARSSGSRTRVIVNKSNVGFGAAVNQAMRESQAPYLAALNDDAVARPDWLEALLRDAEANPKAGMFASHVTMDDGRSLDSAGMLIASDGSSKQRGHGERAETKFDAAALFPSGSAALYRRTMLNEVGGFDEDFFLYCEDVDLGLRARWAGWECRYVPGAIVEHRYSKSAGRASTLKAYLVERNRLYTVVKNFPVAMLLRAPFTAISRYFWHAVSLLEGRGKAAEFRLAGQSSVLLPFLVFRAQCAALLHLPRLLKERRRIFGSRKISSREFQELLRQHAISARQVARL